MARVQLTLLGGFQARLGSAPAPLTSRKAQALLAYLACPIGQAHRRDKLAALLWGGMGEAQARGSLRQAIRAIRKTFGGAEPLVLAGETVALDARVVAADVAELEAQAAAGTPAALERVAAIYAGDLLAGLELQEGPFDEWLLAERERLRGRALDALDSALAQQRAAGAL